VISGPAAAKAVARPALDTLSQSVRDFGEDPAAAHVVKLAGNFLIAAASEAMAEAYTLGEKCGLDRGEAGRILRRLTVPFAHLSELRQGDC
jgi:3-hydroxyisobutyrate dehydrogenase-like beta-hydroxyacid dehydrogenase